MRNHNKNSIYRILNLLDQFIAGEIVNLDKISRKDPQIFHYYTEIIRYWSKLNYIFQKTLRSLKIYDMPQNEIPQYLYLIYRKLIENAFDKILIKELNLSLSEDSDVLRILNKLKTFSWEKALNDKPERENLSIKEAIPTFFIERLLPVMSFKFLDDNVKSMNRYHEYNNFIHIINMRNQLLKESIFNDLKKELKNFHIQIQQDREIPELLIIPFDKKSMILRSKPYISGNLIFQDKGSVAVVKVLSPQPYEFICDMCAAPGNKTILMAQYTQNQTRIIAGEFLQARAYEMAKRINQNDLINIHLINTDSIQFPLRFENQFDRVLLDAPCTGSGTFITNPELKWRQNNDFLYQNITLQEKLIRSSLSLLKPNGIFVYSTCSLYPEEGEMQILKFVDQLEPLKLPEWFSPSYKINDHIIHGTGRLFPSIHHTHGFFIGKFKKKEV